jgi:hypothetical protein
MSVLVFRKQDILKVPRRWRPKRRNKSTKNTRLHILEDPNIETDLKTWNFRY